MEYLYFWLPVTAFAAFMVLIPGIFAYQVIRQMKILEKKLSIIQNFSHQSVKIFGIFGKKIDQLSSQGHKVSEYQSKAFEHQSVLIRSLNRQIRNLDMLLSDRSRLSAQSDVVSTVNGQAKPIKYKAKLQSNRSIVSPNEEPKNERANSRTGIKGNTILLDQLFKEKRTRLNKDRSEKVAKLSAIFDEQRDSERNFSTLMDRRVSNG